MTFWTDDRVSRLKQMHAQGMSFSEIAAALGCTRNMVGSKLTRLTRDPSVRISEPVDWDAREAIIREVQAACLPARVAAARIGMRTDSVLKAARKLGIPFQLRSGGSTAGLKRNGHGHRKRTNPAPRPPVAVPDDAIDILMVHDATEFQPGRCKWPVNESPTPSGHLFCGHDTAMGTPYCNYHNAIAYDLVPDRREVYPARVR